MALGEREHKGSAQKGLVISDTLGATGFISLWRSPDV